MKTYKIITTAVPTCGFKVQDVHTGIQEACLFTDPDLCAQHYQAALESKDRELVVFAISPFDPAAGELVRSIGTRMWVVNGTATPLAA